MNVSFNKLLLKGVSAAIVIAVCATGSAQPRDRQEEAQRLVHVLSYVGGDYGGAVQNGAIVEASEYDEQLGLLDEAAKIAGRLQPDVAAGGPDVVEAVKRVRALVDAKGSEQAVADAVKAAHVDAVRAFHLVETPPGKPNMTRGKRVFVEQCATCHGQTGHADTDRAKSLNPHPANFHDPKVGETLSPLKIERTVQFGIDKTAMVPLTFLSEGDRWDVAFYVAGLRHEAAPGPGAPTYALPELASKSDEELRADLATTGVPADQVDGALADLRRRAPYEDRAAGAPLGTARDELEKARQALRRGERDAARGFVIDAYLEGIEPVEGALRGVDPALTRGIEDRFAKLRSALAADAPEAELEAGIDGILRDVARAEALVGRNKESGTFGSAVLESAGILLREGVEAALLIAALLGVAGQAGLGDKKRWVHAGWMVALAFGAVLWLGSSRLIAMSGARRETTEGVTALVASAVLFYVSYSLLAKREVARWMKFLRAQVTPRRAALSLFGVSLIAAGRETFETVLFYQALLAATPSRAGVLLGIGIGGALLALLVLAYTRAGRFAPPQVFFKVSSWLLYALAVVFVGQGLGALQVVGLAPLHPAKLPSLPILGIYPTIETYAAQIALLAVAAIGAVLGRAKPASAPAAQPQP